MKRQTANFPGLSPFQIAMKIQECEDFGKIVDLLHGSGKSLDKYFAYDFTSFLAGRRSQAICFRQHVATVDSEEVAKCIQLTCSLIEFADAVLNELSDVVHQIALDSTKRYSRFPTQARPRQVGDALWRPDTL